MMTNIVCRETHPLPRVALTLSRQREDDVRTNDEEIDDQCQIGAESSRSKELLALVGDSSPLLATSPAACLHT